MLISRERLYDFKETSDTPGQFGEGAASMVTRILRLDWIAKLLIAECHPSSLQMIEISEQLSRGAYDLNPFFIRSAVGSYRRVQKEGATRLNPFFIRSAVGRFLAAVMEARWCLNPFFIRSAVGRARAGSTRAAARSLNPFFIRSAVGSPCCCFLRRNNVLGQGLFHLDSYARADSGCAGWWCLQDRKPQNGRT